ncbi:MAG: energy transducer TonB [Candidatus Korobacteraceae bacterium]
MRILTLIAFAILITSLATFAAAQSGTKPADSSSMSTTTPASTTDDAAFAAYQRITKDVKPPKATHAPDPQYPDVPADTEPNGVVVMLVGINPKGRVELVHVLRSSNAVFEASAVTTVRTWKFSPAKKDGQPIPVQVTVEMRFLR